MLYMNYLVLVEGLPVVATSVIVFIGKLWDAITDPWMGRISDKTRSRFGRRRLYFLIGIIPVFISFIMMFYSFGMSSTLAKIFYYTFAYMFFGTAFTIVMVPYNAILSDITSDYDERTSFTTVRMLCSGGAALLAAVVPGILIKAGRRRRERPRAEKRLPAYGGRYGGGFRPLAGWLPSSALKRRKTCPRQNRFARGIGSLRFPNKAYRNYLGIFLSFQVGVDLVLAPVHLLYRHRRDEIRQLRARHGRAARVLAGVHGGDGHARQKKRQGVSAVHIGMPVWILTMLAFLFVKSDTPVIVLCILAGLIAVGSSSGNLSTWSMLTDVYDIDEIRTAKRREGRIQRTDDLPA